MPKDGVHSPWLQKILEDSKVPRDIHPVEVHPVGNYGISVKWSDEHDTGIYAFRRLRSLCACEECGAADRTGKEA